MVRNAGLNLRKGRVGRSDGPCPLSAHAISDTISHGGTKKPPRNRNRGSSLAGRPRDTMLIGQTYAKDAGRSCSDLPNYCEYAPRFRAEERVGFCAVNPTDASASVGPGQGRGRQAGSRGGKPGLDHAAHQVKIVRPG